MAGLLCLALTLGLLPSGIVLPARAASWADPYGEKLVEWGVMRGDISGNLNLDRPITRAELVTMINRAYGYSRKAGTPFTDVPSSKWYADDIDIAYNAGYFKGTSSTTASPESNVTREQAAVFLARNLMLQETVGETLGFSDTRTLSEWSRGLIGAAVKEGVLNGYSDGSFKPANNITRGEVAAMLVRAIGTPVDKEGSHSLGHVYGNVTLSASNVTLRNTTIAGNLYLTGGIDLGHVLLENVTVLGKIIVSGAGEAISGQESVTLRNVEAEELVLDSLRSPFVTVKAQGVTDIPLVTVRTNAYVDDSSWEGYGLSRIELRGDPGTKLQLAGSIKEVMNFTPASDLQFVKGSAEKVTVDEDAIASKLLVDKNTRVDELNLDVATTVSGEGDIGKLNVGSAGSVVEQLPDQIVIRPGIDADIDGEIIGSSDAAELSAEPRLMAGYPYMKNIAPTQADGVFSGSKPGTIYWAISAVADGSVSEEDLIENPTYGGNIFQNQAGSIDAASAKTEYISQVQQLEPDGTYYVSAILVDGRGKHSPIKVMSFATPDDTKPAFVKDPTMTKTTTDVAQTTVMANKDCLLYWALLPTGAQAPTPQEFKTGSLGGNYGYGSLSVVKNAEISITVNRQKLREKTTYDLFLWLTDHNGAQSMDAPFKLTFTTPDETPPVVTAPVQIPPYAADSANVTFSMNEAPATLYWAVVVEGDTTFIAPGDTPEETAEIMADLRTKIRVEGAGDSAISSGSAAVTGAYRDTVFQITKLVTATTGTNNYTMYYIGKDAAGNYSDRVRSISIKTLDTKPPEVVQKFTDEVNGQPRASSDIRLEFSETVKGGAKEGGKTFLDFYQAVLSATGAAQEEAKNLLAAELAAHIRLYSVPRNGQPILETPRGGLNGTDADDRTNWVIDFHNARVEQENGKMVITLPNNTDNPDASALQLDSGATYYFQLISVYDNAFIPNGILNPDTGKADPNGNLRLPNFTTIYGQVELARNTSLTAIKQPDNATEEQKKLNGIRLDMCVDVKPESTSKMPETEYWDMIIWSDTGIDVEIYYQKDGGTWELLNSTAIPIQKDGVIGLGTRSEVTSTSHRIQPVKTSLLEDSIYRYGIHITRVGNIKEDSKTTEPQDWSELVTMKFSLVAGTQGDIQNLSRTPASNYDKFVNVDKTATEIGIEYLQNGTRRILEYPKQFTDTRVPEFSTGAPTFEAGSGTIEMSAALQRPGRVYWVAAPVGTIVTGVTANAPVNSFSDGTTDPKKPDGSNNPDYIDPATNKTYVPTSGSDRDAHATDIHFMSGGGTDTDGKGIPAEYYAPYYRDIINGAEVYRNNPVIKTGIKELGTSVEPIPITGLNPNTWYYIYIVREGGGDPNNIVEIYRVKTDVAQPPIITMDSGSTDATMTTIDRNGTKPRVASTISYALVAWDSLPAFFTEKEYTWGSSYKGTIIQAMISRTNGPNSMTYFDAYVDTAKDDDGAPAAVYRDSVMRYVTSNGDGYPIEQRPLRPTWQVNYDPNNPTYQNGVNQPFADYLPENTSSECVVLAVAVGLNAGTSADNYGFAAARGLYRPNPNPPEFVGTTPYLAVVGRLRAYTDEDCTKEVIGWQTRKESSIRNFYFSGSVQVQFSSPVYQAIRDSNNNRLKRAVLTNTATDDKTEVNVLEAIATSMAELDVRNTSATGAQQNFTFDFTGVSANDYITFLGEGDIVNSSPTGQPSPYRVQLVFDPLLTNRDFGADVVDDMVRIEGGFRVTLQPVNA